MLDRCENCGKIVEEWQRVCSNACAGALGGKAKVPKGFAVNKELARIAGSKGGRQRHANISQEEPK